MERAVAKADAAAKGYENLMGDSAVKEAILINPKGFMVVAHRNVAVKSRQ